MRLIGNLITTQKKQIQIIQTFKSLKLHLFQLRIVQPFYQSKGLPYFFFGFHFLKYHIKRSNKHKVI